MTNRTDATVNAQSLDIRFQVLGILYGATVYGITCLVSYIMGYDIFAQEQAPVRTALLVMFSATGLLLGYAYQNRNAVTQPTVNVPPAPPIVQSSDFVRLVARLAPPSEQESDETYDAQMTLDRLVQHARGLEQDSWDATGIQSAQELQARLEHFLADTEFGDGEPENIEEWRNGNISAREDLREALKPWKPLGKPLDLRTYIKPAE